MPRLTLSLLAWAAMTAGPAALAQEAGLLDCDACHLAGDGDAAARLETARYPDLAGLPARYLDRQLDAYRTGLRQHPQMQRTAIALGEGAPAAARRYAAAPMQPSRGDGEAGEAPRLVGVGDWSRGLPPCASCHGPADTPPEQRAALAPILAGQPAEYLAGELRAYASGTRRSDPMGRMRAYSARLTEGEIDRLAAWYAKAARDAPPGEARAAARAGSLGAAEPPGPSGDGPTPEMPR